MIHRDYWKVQAGTFRGLYCDSLYSYKPREVAGRAFPAHYRLVRHAKCRQCRKLPANRKWTGNRVCGCGNPYVNFCMTPGERVALKSAVLASGRAWR